LKFSAKFHETILIHFHENSTFSAVRTGDVTKFEVVRSKYVDQFKSDRTFTLILRLHHNVIKTAIRRISLAYSRISLADVAAKLKLESPKDAEYIIAKVQYEKSIFHSGKFQKKIFSVQVVYSKVFKSSAAKLIHRVFHFKKVRNKLLWH